MKKTNKILSLLLGLAIVVGVSSCKDDDPQIPSGDDGIPVADGFYLAKEGADPAAAAVLTPATVDAPDFQAMEREGFYQGYMYLTQGNYQLVEVKSKVIVSTIGGTLSVVSGDNVHNPECDPATSSYNLVATENEGAAFAVPADGLYVVGYDVTLGEIIFDQIESAGIIGDATPGGWSTDTPMVGTIAAEGVTWTLEGVTLDAYNMKFRFNCRWAIDRRLDKNLPFANDNGYSMFTNFGNEIGNLLPGNEGSNISVPEYAVYTVTLTWDPDAGFSATLTKTGDATPKPTYPTDLFMVGQALGGWDWNVNGIQLVPVYGNPHLFWKIVWLDAAAGADGFKFAPQRDWIGDFGIDNTVAPTNGVYVKGTQNVPAPATTGYYMVVVNLEPGSETVEVNAPMVYGIGDAFNGDWTAANSAYQFTVDNAAKTIYFNSIPSAGDLRMHVAASTMNQIGTTTPVDWWQAEFIVLNGVIEYRGTGGDQTRVQVTAGQTVTLDFVNETGTIQ